MKLRALIKKLEKLERKHGDLHIMLISHSADTPCEVSDISFEVAQEGDYPKDWGMPAGFKFIQLYT